MSEEYILGSYKTCDYSIKQENNDQNIKNDTKYATNPISQKNENIFVNNNTKNETITLDDDSIIKEIKNTKNTQEQEYEFYDDFEKEFTPTAILDEYEITKDDLQYATGEQLLGLYFEADYGDDSNYTKHNAMLMTLLSGAEDYQLKSFMKTFDELTRNNDIWDENYNFSYDNLGKQLLYASRAKEIAGDETYNEFLETVSKYPEYFPSYGNFGISYGIQFAD